jgi:Replication-relaxation
MALIQPRDMQVFAELNTCRFLSLPQLAQLCFNGNLETARKRLQKLRGAGYIECQRLLHAVPACVWMTAKASTLLGRPRSHSHRPNLASLRHELVIRDFRMRLLLDAPEYGMDVETVRVQAEDISFNVRGCRHRPDAFLTLGGKTRKHYFLEIDLGTESIRVFTRKIEQYERLFKRGAFAARFDAPPGRYRDYPFQVLAVFDSPTRQERVLAALREDGYRHFLLAARLPEACATPLAEIWTSPAREAKTSLGSATPPSSSADFA